MPTTRSCNACGQLIYFGGASGRMPITAATGKPHWGDCAAPQQFRRPPADSAPRPPPTIQQRML